MYYLAEWDSHDSAWGDIVDSDESFTNLVDRAADEVDPPWVVLAGDEDGPQETMAYYDSAFAPRTVYIVAPGRAPKAWAPGKRHVMGLREMTIELAPESIPTTQVMVRTAVRGLPYPKVLQQLGGFVDLSYGNDVTDSVGFVAGDDRFVIFIEPASIPARSPEGKYDHAKRFTVYSVAKGDDESWQIDTEMFATESPDDLVAFTDHLERERALSPADLRYRMMDMGPRAREVVEDEAGSPTSQRYALLELNGGRRRQNPAHAGRAQAVAKYEEFHRFPPKKIGEFSSMFEIPDVLYRGGAAKWVTYRSDKTDPASGKRPKGAVDYVHEHDAGVEVFLAKGSGKKVTVPERFRTVDALCLLGTNLGYAFVDDTGDEWEAISKAPMPELYTVPDGKCLLVVQSKKTVLAMIWGGALGVFARGIDG